MISFVVFCNVILYILRVFRFFCFWYYTNDKFLTNEYKEQGDTTTVPLTSRILIEPQSIITWNVHGLSLYLDPIKISSIIDTINHYLESDVICLQECFDEQLIREIIKNTKIKYWYHQTGNLKKKYVIGENSGLLILSKIPITFISFNSFQEKGGIETLSNKGFMLCNIGGLTIVNAHLQSHEFNICCSPINTIINYQIKQIKKNTHDENTIYCGDFNTEFVDKQFDISLNNLKSTVTNENFVIDYIFTRENNIKLDVDVINLPTNPSDHKPMIARINNKI